MFDEQFAKLKHVHPLAETCVDFDWETLEHDLGETVDGEDSRVYKATSEALRAVLAWIVKGGDIGAAGRRAVALAWSLDPEIAGGMTQREVAKLFGVKRARIAYFAAAASKRYKLKPRFQSQVKLIDQSNA